MVTDIAEEAITHASQLKEQNKPVLVATALWDNQPIGILIASEPVNTTYVTFTDVIENADYPTVTQRILRLENEGVLL